MQADETFYDKRYNYEKLRRQRLGYIPLSTFLTTYYLISTN